MKVYIPVYTHCSDCGTYSGYSPVGPAFTSRDEADKFLSANKNPSRRWGDGEKILEVEVQTDLYLLSREELQQGGYCV